MKPSHEIIEAEEVRFRNEAALEELSSVSHFHYAGRIVDVADDLPKRD